MSLNAKIKERRNALKLNRAQLAKMIGVTPSAIANYENGVSAPKMELMPKLFQALKCDANYLFMDNEDALDSFAPEETDLIDKYRALDEFGKNVVKQSLEHEYMRCHSPIRVPMIDLPFFRFAPSAGTGVYVPDEVEMSYVSVPKTRQTNGADYVLQVNGKSMEPEYPDGSCVLVKKQETVNPGEIGIFVVDGESYIKEYRKDSLHSLNPDYGDIYFDENQYIQCMGKVVGKLNRF